MAWAHSMAAGSLSVLAAERSDTPFQRSTLNDPAAIECAQAIARKVAGKTGVDLKASATYAFRLVLARAPEPKEVERLAALFQSELKNYQTDAKSRREDAGMILATHWTNRMLPTCGLDVVANVLLNLDETITKG